MKTKFRTGYDDDYKSSDYDTHNLEPSLTHQSFKDECDINSILSSMQASGLINGSSDVQRFEDVADSLQYQDALNYILDADSSFASLSADVRARFNNDPFYMLQFLENDKNRDEAIRLGLVNPAEPVPSSLDVMGTTDTKTGVAS